MIKFQNVTKIYDANTTVLQDVSFEIKHGEFVSIVGKSGAGKTSLTKLILGLESPPSGIVNVFGKNVSELKSPELQELRRKVGCIYQDYRLLTSKNVHENVSYITAVEGRENSEITNEVPRVLEAIGLSDKMDNFPRELSGGEQQRLAVARALINNPDLVIADEPTGNLDPYNTYEVISLLEKVHKSGKTVILLTHDKEVINKLKKRVITIDNGKVVRDEENGSFVI